MIKFPLFLSVAFLFLGCSSTPVKNEWQVQSVNAYESSKLYFLKDENTLASTDLKRAKKYARQSADLSTLAKIELSQCALHVSVLQDDNCSAYKELEPLAKDSLSHSYYLFLQNKYTQKDINNLPARYKNFAAYKLAGDYEQAQRELLSTKEIISKSIMASLIKEKLDANTVKVLIDELSFYGYKKAVLAWLEFYQTKLNNTDEIEDVKKRLQVLKDTK